LRHKDLCQLGFCFSNELLFLARNSAFLPNLHVFVEITTANEPKNLIRIVWTNSGVRRKPEWISGMAWLLAQMEILANPEAMAAIPAGQGRKDCGLSVERAGQTGPAQRPPHAGRSWGNHR
jgi:hypothetical protein